MLFVSALPCEARELWGGLSRLVDENGRWPDIALCSYTNFSGAQTANSETAHASQPGMVVASGTLCDPCQPRGGALGGSVLGRGAAGQAGLFGPLPSEEESEERSERVGPRSLFTTNSPWDDPSARGSTWLWVAPSWGNATWAGVEESRFGVAEGIITSYRLPPGFGLYGSLAFIHDEEMTTFFTTIGVQKFGNPGGGGLLQRASAWVFWDACVDKLDGDESHFQQIRCNFGVVGPAGAEVGVAFSVSLDEPADYFLLPVGGTGLLSTGGSVVGPYIRYPIGIFDVTAMLGYSGVSNSGVLGLGAEARLTENSSLFLDWKTGGAEAADGPSTILAGYKLGFGRADATRY